MPKFLAPSSLYTLSSKCVASSLLEGCQALDKMWVEPAQEEQQVLLSPSSPPGREEVYLHLSPTHRTVLDWLSNLPDMVVEKVVMEMLGKMEVKLLEDKDKKLIMTMINIEQMKMNDFFFGVHSLLSLIQWFEMQSLNFSKRLMFCLWEYSEITSSRLLVDTLCSSLPGLTSITSLHTPHIATDKLVYTISKCLHNLVDLDISSSRVTDRGVKCLAGSNNLTYINQVQFAELVKTLDIPKDIDTTEDTKQEGCLKLEHLNLQSCEWVTEMGLRFILEHLPCLRKVKYHQRSSLLEIIIKWVSCMNQAEVDKTRLNLVEVEHGFPYGLSPLSEHMTKLALILPHLTSITIVTSDTVVSLLAMFPNLINIAVELEDCLGEGFISLLESQGAKLEEISLSCSSDPEATLSLDQIEGEGGQQGHLFNLGTVCVGLLARNVRKLSVSGCGLVSSAAVRRIKLHDKLGSSNWMRRQTGNWYQSLERLILMSYEDTVASMSINSGLLKSVLVSARNMTILNLEGNFGSIFTDSFLTEIVNLNPLSLLRILDICVNDQQGQVGRIPLTVTTVQLLISKCECLKELRISDWDVSNQQFGEITRMVKENNWDLLVTRKIEM